MSGEKEDKTPTTRTINHHAQTHQSVKQARKHARQEANPCAVRCSRSRPSARRDCRPAWREACGPERGRRNAYSWVYALSAGSRQIRGLYQHAVANNQTSPSSAPKQGSSGGSRVNAIACAPKMYYRQSRLSMPAARLIEICFGSVCRKM